MFVCVFFKFSKINFSHLVSQGRTLEQIEAFFNGDRSACDGGGQGTDLVKITGLTLMLIVGLIVMGTSL